ncbi:membrane protein YczE [Actinacidiphila acidipaludis]|uniref:membrane protein YczE n=1 Tax=Actinacidiphila acidipaludis TaxID=2873382 RepID=UPI00223AEBD8
MSVSPNARGVAVPSSRSPLRASPYRGPVPYRRLVRLYAGLALYGFSDALLVRAHVGLDPWDVFHQGLSRHTGLSIGVVSIVVGAAVLLLWWPIRQRPGLGTVSNVVLVGTFIDLTMAVVPQYAALAVRVPLMVAAVVLNGAATGLYITARFGPGPRDGLMTGLHRRTRRSLRLIRTGIELSVLAAGFLLGGGVGAGTVFYALAIGPLAQFFLKRFALPEDGAEGSEEKSGTPEGPVGAGHGPVPGSAGVRGGSPEPAAVDTI